MENENFFDISPWDNDEHNDTYHHKQESLFFLPAKFQNLKTSKKTLQNFLQKNKKQNLAKGIKKC